MSYCLVWYHTLVRSSISGPARSWSQKSTHACVLEEGWIDIQNSFWITPDSLLDGNWVQCHWLLVCFTLWLHQCKFPRHGSELTICSGSFGWVSVHRMVYSILWRPAQGNVTKVSLFHGNASWLCCSGYWWLSKARATSNNPPSPSQKRKPSTHSLTIYR